MQRENIIETLKNKCFDRIKSKRRSMLDERRRQNILKAQTESKAKQEVNKGLAQDQDMLDEIIRKEIMSIH